MPALRDYLGQRCPCCARDILQQAPSTNRMPTDRAWCPTCQSTLSLDDLERRGSKKKGGSLLKRLFGGPQSA